MADEKKVKEKPTVATITFLPGRGVEVALSGSTNMYPAKLERAVVLLTKLYAKQKAVDSVERSKRVTKERRAAIEKTQKAFDKCDAALDELAAKAKPTAADTKKLQKLKEERQCLKLELAELPAA